MLSTYHRPNRLRPDDDAIVPIHYETGKPVYNNYIKGKPFTWCSSECNNRWSYTHSSGTHTGIERINSDSETNVRNKRQRIEFGPTNNRPSSYNPKLSSDGDDDIWKANYDGLMQKIRRLENDFENLVEEKEALFRQTKLLRWRLRCKTLELQLERQTRLGDLVDKKNKESETGIETKPEQARTKSEPEEKIEEQQKDQTRIKVPFEARSMYQNVKRKQEKTVPASPNNNHEEAVALTERPKFEENHLEMMPLEIKDTEEKKGGSPPPYTPDQKEFIKRVLPRFRSHIETPWKENEQKLERELASERTRNEDLLREVKYWKA